MTKRTLEMLDFLTHPDSMGLGRPRPGNATCAIVCTTFSRLAERVSIGRKVRAKLDLERFSATVQCCVWSNELHASHVQPTSGL